jgi:flagellar basal-body rod protein FlgG
VEKAFSFQWRIPKMMNGLHASAASMRSLERQHETISMNLANISTPGYKKRLISFQSILEETAGTMIPGVSHGVMIDRSSGFLTRSGRDLDVALEGDGFFAVETPWGERYSRKGDFTINKDGELATREGYRVLGTGGPIKVTDGKGALGIDESGRITRGQRTIGTLKVVSLPANAALVPEEGGVFSSSLPPDGPSAAKVKQGYLESSNVNSMDQLAEMIVCMRQFEANKKAIETMRVAMEKGTQ